MRRAPQRTVTFHWTATAERLRELARRVELAVDPKGHSFVALDAAGNVTARFVPPLVLPIAPGTRAPHDYLAELPAQLGVQLVVLVQAGAAALGVWREDECLAHKAVAKYVVRGSGRAQPTHLKTKGKSRYGSRLRLRNARALLVEVNERMRLWHAEHGPFDRVFYSCPVRTWAEVFRAEPPPPLRRDDDRLARIPLDVHVPTFVELQRVRGFLTHGQLVVP